MIRLNKLIAEAGIASRRGADELIARGKVLVNGQVVRELGVKIEPTADVVEVNGKRISSASSGKKFVYIMLNKPKGYVCTTRRFAGEKNVLDLVSVKDRLFPVGRLDKDSDGLLILTNDGDFADQLTHPRYEHEKEYRVFVDRKVSQADIILIQRGVRDQGELLRVEQVKASAASLTIILKEGKKRHIRRMLEKIGFRILTLTRVRVGKLHLGGMPQGAWKYVERSDVM